MFKKVIFFILGAAITYIATSYFITEVEGDAALAVSAASILFGGLVGSSLAKRAAGESSGIGRVIVWILTLAIIGVAIVVFFGLNSL